MWGGCLYGLCMDGAQQLERAERFRELHHSDDPLLLPNPWDVGSARLFQHLGFEGLATTGGGRAFSLGLPDGSTQPEQLLTYARDIADATDLPVTADLEDGFGDTPEAIAAVITQAAAVGLVGGSIEDRSYGRDHRRPGVEPYPIPFAAERIAAAVDSADRLPFPFTVTARCENHLVGNDDLADTIQRLQAYQDAGAHCLYAPGLSTLAEVRAVVDSVDAPVNVLIGRSTEPMTVDALAELGVKRISIGSGIHRAAMATVIAAAIEVRDAGTCSFADNALPHDQACAIYTKWAGQPGS